MTGSAPPHSPRRMALASLLLWIAGCHLALAEQGGLPPPLPMHALEQRALVAPIEVLRAMPEALRESQSDPKQQTLLYLAQANACRVIANWRCQAAAAYAAEIYAARAKDKSLLVKAKVIRSRGTSALQDYNLSSRLLTEASALLEREPNPFLSAEIDLANSSIGNSLGRYAESAEFARRGLNSLDDPRWESRSDDDPLRVRLLRNLGRAQALLGRADTANTTLQRAREKVRGLADPKLRAEVSIELNRIAVQRRDTALMDVTAREILAYGEEVPNTQLTGMGLEALATVARVRGDTPSAIRDFRRAADYYGGLGLERDQLRAIQALLPLLADRPAQAQPLALEALTLSGRIAQSDRREAGDDFEQRIRYERDLRAAEISRAEAELRAAQAQTDRYQFYISLVVALLALVSAAALGALYYLQRQRNEAVLRAQSRRHRAMAATSHDIRNALVGISGTVDLLLRKPVGNEIRHQLEHIRSAGDNLQGLAQDLMDSERLEQGRLPLQDRPVVMAGLLDSLLYPHLLRAGHKQLRLRLHWDPELPEVWSIDPLRLDQVLSNLIGNAVKFTDQGEVVLDIARVDAIRKPGVFEARFSVKDTGVGIPAHELATLFHPFEKGELGERFGSGAGLGLSIAYELVRLMGGELQVLSEPGQGSQFYFNLLLKEAEAPADVVVSDASSRLKDLRVLLVEDDPISRELHELYLEQIGCHAVSCDSVGSALSHLGIARFDVLVTDYHLPDGSGADLIQRMRGLLSGSGHRCVSVMVSGLTPSGLRGESLADAWVMKPANADKLRDGLMLALDGKRAVEA